MDMSYINSNGGWIETGINASHMNSHNGYYDTLLELGYVGYGFLITFILASLHAVGRVADRDRGRARLCWRLFSIHLLQLS
jgi:hypothetical protein